MSSKEKSFFRLTQHSGLSTYFDSVFSPHYLFLKARYFPFGPAFRPIPFQVTLPVVTTTLTTGILGMAVCHPMGWRLAGMAQFFVKLCVCTTFWQRLP